LKSLKARRGLEPSRRSQIQKGKDAKVIGQKPLRSLNERSKFSEGESRSFVGRWILQTSGEIKAECLLALISSGGIVVFGSGSTRVVDLVFKNFRFRIRSVEEVVTHN
jgi:hypothetical protein